MKNSTAANSPTPTTTRPTRPACAAGCAAGPGGRSRRVSSGLPAARPARISTIRSQRSRHRTVVGDDHQRGPGAAVQPQQQVHHSAGRRRVQRAGRFVGEHQAGSVHQGPRDRYPLPLPAGELVGNRCASSPMSRASSSSPRQVGSSGTPASTACSADVLRDGEERLQVVGLEHETDPLPAHPRSRPVGHRRHQVLTDSHRSAVGSSSPPSRPSRVDFPEPLGPTIATLLTGLDGQVDTVERHESTVRGRVLLAQASHLHTRAADGGRRSDRAHRQASRLQVVRRSAAEPGRPSARPVRRG